MYGHNLSIHCCKFNEHILHNTYFVYIIDNLHTHKLVLA